VAASLDRRRQPCVGLPRPGRAVCKLSDARGPAAQEWAGWTSDQRWTLARVTALIRRLFGVGYTLRGVSCLLHQIG
jgi:transposase